MTSRSRSRSRAPLPAAPSSRGGQAFQRQRAPAGVATRAFAACVWLVGKKKGGEKISGTQVHEMAKPLVNALEVKLSHHCSFFRLTWPRRGRQRWRAMRPRGCCEAQRTADPEPPPPGVAIAVAPTLPPRGEARILWVVLRDPTGGE